ncbi:energy transducer TonB [uncultured Tenacibaculum sp.]|uniref:energy transducer TonB n=1 Tax=uncultured Tenacibaculum sp. TaxID=174713 RepID=UPI0026286601|nr:energy transducer TonB [uncultured Tenacibaculum sp.]
MKDLHWLLLCLLYVLTVTSQSNKTCEKQETIVIQDLNSINKCKVEDKSKNNQSARHIILGFNNSKSRFFRKRRKELAKAVNSISSKGISNNKKEIKLSGDVDIKESEEKVFTFQNVDQLPVFKNCEDSDNNLRCFNVAIGNFIQENFEYPDEAIDNEIVGKITVNFVINKEGKVVDIKATNEENKDNILTNYSEKLISKLSKVAPAKKNGKPVAVSYELYLDFSL